MTVPAPPDLFDPAVDVLSAGTELYRVTSHPVAAFNPGVGGPTRFAFFGVPPVPVLYAAQTQDAAVAETLLHDVPLSGGYLLPADYADRVMGRIQLLRELRLASFRGLGLRRLGVAAEQLNGTDADTYPQTVRWAAAAHRAGLDGVSWTSRRCDDAQAVVLFGDIAGDAVEQDVSFGRYFAGGPGLTWLIDVCAPLRVDVLPRH